MNHRILPAFGIVLSLLGLVMCARGQNPPGLKELRIGDPAPAFKLVGVDDRTMTLDNFNDFLCCLQLEQDNS